MTRATPRAEAKNSGSQSSFALNADGRMYGLVGLDRGYVWTFGVEALALADNTRCAVADQVSTMRFVPPSFQITSGPGLKSRDPRPAFLAALESDR